MARDSKERLAPSHTNPSVIKRNKSLLSQSKRIEVRLQTKVSRTIQVQEIVCIALPFTNLVPVPGISVLGHI